MAVRVDRSLRRYIQENKDLLIQVQKCSDPEAATAALRRAADDVWALDGGWESAFGLSPGDRNGPTAVGVRETPSGPVLAVDTGHTPEKLLETIPSLIVRRLEEEGVADARVARPKQTETLGFVVKMPRAVVLHAYAAPLIPWFNQTSSAMARVPDRLLSEGCRWLTEGVPAEYELWALIQPMLDLSLRASDAEEFVGDHGGLLVAGRTPSAAPSRRAKAERWSDEERQADALQRIGTRVRCLKVGNRRVTLVAGGSDASEDDLIQAFAELRAIARRMAPDLTYAFVTYDPTFEHSLGSALHYRWSPNAPQASPGTICDEVVFDAFHSQVLGPGHLRRLGGAPAGAEPLEAGRVEVVIGDARSWLPTLREQGRAVLAPCLVSRRSDVLRLIHERFQGTSSDPEADGAAVRRRLWRFGRRPVQQLDELLADPERVSDFRLVARQRVLGDEPTQVAALAGRPSLPLRSALRLWDLERRIALHLFAPPPPSIDGFVALPQHVLDAAGRWLVADAAQVRAVVDVGWAYALSPADAIKLLTSWTGAAPETSLAAVSHDGLARIVVVEDGLFVPHLTLAAGRLPDDVAPARPPAAHDEILTEFEALTAIARTLAAELGYAFATIDERPVRFEADIAASICDELVLDAFPFQILGPGHGKRLGGLPRGVRTLGSGMFELTVGDVEDWFPGVRDSGRALLTPCLVTAEEARALEEARRQRPG